MQELKNNNTTLWHNKNNDEGYIFMETRKKHSYVIITIILFFSFHLAEE